jgi:hypothetical protein
VVSGQWPVTSGSPAEKAKSKTGGAGEEKMAPDFVSPCPARGYGSKNYFPLTKPGSYRGAVVSEQRPAAAEEGGLEPERAKSKRGGAVAGKVKSGNRKSLRHKDLRPPFSFSKQKTVIR